MSEDQENEGTAGINSDSTMTFSTGTWSPMGFLEPRMTSNTACAPDLGDDGATEVA